MIVKVRENQGVIKISPSVKNRHLRVKEIQALKVHHERKGMVKRCVKANRRPENGEKAARIWTLLLCPKRLPELNGS